MGGKGEIAEKFFREGYNCAQSVFLAFAQEAGLDMRQAALLSGGFGGGIGRLRETCGALSGAVMAMGALNGYPGPERQEEKARLYRDIQEFVRRFEEKNGSHNCRELLLAAGLSGEAGASPQPEERTREYYARRPCPRLVRDAADMLEEYLRECGK